MKRSDTQISLGYEVGTGAPVSIPLRNLCITGQTQEAGKTTALEGIISRFDGARAVAFVTKRHESGFNHATRIAPYFRERADWQFVASVLEAALKQGLKFQRSWIMKLCEYKAPTVGSGKRPGTPGWHAPRSLADVLSNVDQALLTATGINESVYTELRGYLRMVVPQIERLPYSSELRLAPGLNVMNLVDYSTELCALVIRSVLEAVYANEENTVTILPEAWEFIPQKRGSPVKLAAESLIRKGSAGRNYIFLDSQDLANVDKDIVRSCPVMLLGVQRELEMKREVIRVDGTSVKGRIAELIREDYFSVRRQAGETHKRILDVGINCTRPAVNQALDDLTEKRFFLRTKDTSSHVFYKAVDGMKVNVIDR